MEISVTDRQGKQKPQKREDIITDCVQISELILKKWGKKKKKFKNCLPLIHPSSAWASL